MWASYLLQNLHSYPVSIKQVSEHLCMPKRYSLYSYDEKSICAKYPYWIWSTIQAVCIVWRRRCKQCNQQCLSSLWLFCFHWTQSGYAVLHGLNSFNTNIMDELWWRPWLVFVTSLFNVLYNKVLSLSLLWITVRSFFIRFWSHCKQIRSISQIIPLAQIIFAVTLEQLDQICLPDLFWAFAIAWWQRIRDKVGLAEMPRFTAKLWTRYLHYHHINTHKLTSFWWKILMMVVFFVF